MVAESDQNDDDARERVRALVHSSISDVVFHLRVEGDRFRFLEINPSFTKATGLGSEQVVGKLVDEIIPEPSLSLVLANYRKAIREGHTVRWEEVTPYPTGKKIGEVSITPVLDAHGACTHLVGTVQDVTALREHAEQIRLYADIVSHVQIGLTVWNVPDPAAPETITLAASNPAASELLGLDLSASLARPLAEILPDSAGARLLALVANVARDDAVREVQVGRGDERTFSVKAFPLPGSSVGLAIEDVTAQVRAYEQLRQLSARIDAAREDERTGIARELHDELGQAVTVLKMDLAWIARHTSAAEGLSREVLLEKVTDLMRMSDEIIGEVRRISAELRPAILDHVGLSAALVWKAQEFSARTQIACNVDSTLSDDIRLERGIVTAVFRVFQEALTNVARHADARRVDVSLATDDSSLVLEVRDDGRGITPSQIEDPRSLGLLGIRERARRLGGSVSFAPSSPHGTVVTLSVPLSGARPVQIS